LENVNKKDANAKKTTTTTSASQKPARKESVARAAPPPANEKQPAKTGTAVAASKDRKNSNSRAGKKVRSDDSKDRDDVS
jgi:hypothetical protein